MSYFDTLIAVADDCPVRSAVKPPSRNGHRTAALVQYELLAGRPHELTQEDVLFESWLAGQDLPSELSSAERERLREDFFARPQPCLRSSPLPKRYGWGFLFDGEGKVALCPMESDDYRRLAGGEGPRVNVLRALRTSRA